MRLNRDIAGLHLAAILLGGTALFAKTIPLPAWELTGLRSIMAAGFLGLLLALWRRPLRLSGWRQYLVVLVSGVFFAVHWMTYFYAMQVSTVAVGIIALFTFPVITAFLEPLLDRRWPSVTSLAMGCAVSAGVALITLGSNVSGSVGAGLALGIFSALCYAVRNIMVRRYLSGVSGPLVMLYQAGVTALVFLPWALQPVTQLSATTWFMLLALATLFTAIPHSLIAHGLRSISATSVAFVLALQVFYAMLFAGIVLLERPGPETLIGALVIVTASVYASVQAAGAAARTETVQVRPAGG